jgi:hypothetical protein
MRPRLLSGLLGGENGVRAKNYWVRRFRITF